MCAKESAYSQKPFLPWPTFLRRIPDNADNPAPLSMVRSSSRIADTQNRPANDTATDIADMPVRPQTTPETLDMSEDNPHPQSAVVAYSQRRTLPVVVACVKWIPPFLILAGTA
jgi:hypothetical protein